MSNPIEANPPAVPLEKSSLQLLEAILRIGGPMALNGSGTARSAHDFLGHFSVDGSPLLQANHNPSLCTPSNILTSLNSLASMDLVRLLSANNLCRITATSNISQQERNANETRIPFQHQDLKLQSHLTGSLHGVQPSPLATATKLGVYQRVTGEAPSPKTRGVSSEAIDRLDVRKDKVAEALRSKPQRGKKRDDLSEEERLELTRTRNREHAKSTRQRKKARYQELLDHEEMFLRHQSLESLQSDRIACIQTFLSVRQQILIDSLQGNVVEQTDENLPTWSVMDVLTGSKRNYQFESFASRGCLMANDSQDTFTKIFEWDKALEFRTRSFLTKEGIRPQRIDLSTLRYQIEGGDDGIAFSRNNSAFCRVSLTIELQRSTVSSAMEPRRRCEILRGICHFKFSRGSKNISSTGWTILVDQVEQELTWSCSKEGEVTPYTSAASVDETGHPERECQINALNSQPIHPSTVSLDRMKNSKDEAIST